MNLPIAYPFDAIGLRLMAGGKRGGNGKVSRVRVGENEVVTTSRRRDTERPARTRPAAPKSASVSRILVVDDEPSLVELLHRTMRSAGFQCATATSVESALSVAAEYSPHLALLDVMLPDGSGIDLCRQLRAVYPELAVVFITARDSMGDKISGLNAGGDDYITKPFSVGEVVARVNAVLRRTGVATHAGTWVVDDLMMDDDAHRVTRAGAEITLSPTEYKLLRLLMENSGRVLSKQQIIAQVWDYDFPGDPGMVEKFVSQLRRKLGTEGPPLLHTVRGFGYVMRVPS